MSNYEQAVLELVSLYQAECTRFLTEGDIVLQLNTLLHNIPNTTFEVHTELRPWMPKSDNVIRGSCWKKRERLNWAAKVDLAVVDARAHELMKPTSKGVWSTCTLCGVRVKAGNMVNHMSWVHPETIRG